MLEQQYYLLSAVFSIIYCSNFKSHINNALDVVNFRTCFLTFKTESKLEEKYSQSYLEEGFQVYEALMNRKFTVV